MQTGYLDDEQPLGINLPHPPSCAVTRNKRKVVGHEKKTHPTHTKNWDDAKGAWKKTKTDYV